MEKFEFNKVVEVLDKVSYYDIRVIEFLVDAKRICPEENVASWLCNIQPGIKELNEIEKKHKIDKRNLGVFNLILR